MQKDFEESSKPRVKGQKGLLLILLNFSVALSTINCGISLSIFPA